MWTLLAFIAVCFLAAFAGSLATQSSLKTWYPTIKKPSWNPPNWVFAPVWSTLYLCMAVAAWLVWERLADKGSAPIVLFFVQLTLNALWSMIFFGMRQLGWACVEVGVLWCVILLTTAAFWKVYWPAGALFVPYLLWVSFAALLNLTVWRLNAESGENKH